MRVAEGPASPDSHRSESCRAPASQTPLPRRHIGSKRRPPRWAGKVTLRACAGRAPPPPPSDPEPGPERVWCRNYISQGLAWWSRFPRQVTPQHADPHVRIWFRSGQHDEDRHQRKVDKGTREVMPGERRLIRREERNPDAPQVLSRRQVEKERSRAEDRAITSEGSGAVLRPRERSRC